MSRLPTHFRADVGIRAGRIVAVAAEIEGATLEIDASRLLVLPGGIDSHVHIAQPSGPHVVIAEENERETNSRNVGFGMKAVPVCPRRDVRFRGEDRKIFAHIEFFSV